MEEPQEAQDERSSGGITIPLAARRGVRMTPITRPRRACSLRRWQDRRRLVGTGLCYFRDAEIVNRPGFFGGLCLPGAPNGQATPVTASGTPAQLCTFRPAIAARPRERPQPPATRTGRRRRGPQLSHPTAAPCSGE